MTTPTIGHQPTGYDLEVACLALDEMTTARSYGPLYGLVAALLQDIARAHPACPDSGCGICPPLRIAAAIHQLIREKTQ